MSTAMAVWTSPSSAISSTSSSRWRASRLPLPLSPQRPSHPQRPTRPRRPERGRRRRQRRRSLGGCGRRSRCGTRITAATSTSTRFRRRSGRWALRRREMRCIGSSLSTTPTRAAACVSPSSASSSASYTIWELTPSTAMARAPRLGMARARCCWWARTARRRRSLPRRWRGE